MGLKIGFDARLLDESGVGRYIRNLLLQLGKLDSENQYFIFMLGKDLNKINFADNFHKIETNISWYSLKEQKDFPKILDKYNLDLVHLPHFNVPIFYRKKFVVTIHDLIHQHFAMTRASTHGKLIYTVKQLGYKVVFSNAVRKSEGIITPTEYVKKQLIQEWNILPSKVVVTHEGVEENILELAEKMNSVKVNEILQKYNINFPYIFYVGNAHPHKNIEGLIKAFFQLKKNNHDLSLVLAGKDHYFWQQIKAKYADKEIKYVGFITDEELVALYKGALCYAIPSFEEGFGIPLLEAFACGCPVVAADIGALKEIGGDAAIFFNPKNTDEMALTIEKLCKDVKLRGELIKKGEDRYKDFSWRKLAEKTLQVYNNIK